MSGNVWDWTRSPRWSYPYDPKAHAWADADVAGNAGGMVRGGAFNRNRREVRSAFRHYYFSRYSLDRRYNNLGFRVSALPIPLLIL